MKVLAVLAISLTLVSCGSPEAAPSTVPNADADIAAPKVVVPADVFTDANRADHAAMVERLAEGEPVFAGLPNPSIISCGLNDQPDECSFDQWKFLVAWRGAYEGDYGDQRNVAFCLTQGCRGVVSDQVQGCAWRSVIIAASDPEMGDGDVANFQTDCGRLSEAARVAADGHARRIAAQIDG